MRRYQSLERQMNKDKKLQRRKEDKKKNGKRPERLRLTRLKEKGDEKVKRGKQEKKVENK